MIIEEGKERKTEVKAFSNESCSIFVESETLEDAINTLQAIKKDAFIKCEEWEPIETDPEACGVDPRQEEPKKHYNFCYFSTEDIQETILSFEESDFGQKFLKTLQKSKKLREEKEKHSLSATQVLYLMALETQTPLTGLIMLYDYAYAKGYKTGYTTAINHLKAVKK